MKLYTLVVAIVCCLAVEAQEMHERVFASTDRTCYLTGEVLRLRVEVRIDQDATSMPSPSRVAYVEISDTKQMYVQAMVALENGIGWAEIPVAPQMHSGNYQLTIYTRGMRNHGAGAYYRSIVGVVNAERLSRRDELSFMPSDQYAMTDSETAGRTLIEGDVADHIRVNVPDNLVGHSSLSIERVDLMTERVEADANQIEKNSEEGKHYAFEIEGHIVSARPAGKNALADSTKIMTRMVMVGKTSAIFDGQPQADGTFCYYTNGIYGTLPTLVNGYDYGGNAIPMKLMSPYAMSLPSSLPPLTVYCSKEDIVARANDARRQNAINEWAKSDSLSHTLGFMSTEPHKYYDLDNYTKFNTIREILIEFVKGVKRRKYHGVNHLYTFDPNIRKYSEWPALVLLDGMPVYDIDEILNYDAHLVKHVQIYTDKYTFGNSCCQGVISFITVKGRLSNYKLDSGSRLVSYSFPQNRPAIERNVDEKVAYWDPNVSEKQIEMPVPTRSGRYRIVLQGVDEKGNSIRIDDSFEVK